MSVAPYAEFGKMVAEAREAAGISRQAELASRVKVTQQSISRWEAGLSRPRLSQLPKLATVLGLDVDRLAAAAGYAPAAPQGGGVTFDRPLPVENFSPETFERFVADFLARRYPEANIARAGGTSHTQDGLDVVARLPSGETHTFQCKRVQSFGPEKVKRAIAAHTASADLKHLVLSSVASPQARAAAEAADWEVWDRDDLSRMFRQLAEIDQNSLINTFFPSLRFELTGRDDAGPWVTTSNFFQPFEARAGVFSHNWSLRGRDDEVAAISDALDSERLTLVVSPGGFGKSRVLKEALDAYGKAHPATIVRFLSPTQAVEPKDFEAFGSRDKIIAVDDAHDREDLGTLFEYSALQDHHMRLIFGSRPYGVDRIKRQAAVFGVQPVRQIDLAKLTKAQLREIATEVLTKNGAEVSWADHVLALAGSSPLITVMAASIMAREPMIPQLIPNKEELKNFVLGKFEKVITGDLGLPADQQTLARLMDVLALIQPFDIRNDAFTALITRVLGVDAATVTRLVRILVEGGVLFKRGRLFRLMPDVLGDYLIDRSCLDAVGQLSPFARDVVDSASGQHLTNVVLNLGRLDWRRNEGDPSGSDLLASVWSALAQIENEFDPKLDAALAVAPYQPRQALDYVANLLDDPPGDYLPRILARIAHSGSHLDEACDLLWELGKNDQRETGPNPSHPIRTLAELVGIERNKPFWMNEQAFEFGMSLFDRADAWDARYSPFDVVGAILKSEGVHTTSTVRAFQMAPFVVNYDLVAPLRQRVIDKVVSLLTDLRPVVARRAAQFLAQTVQPPHGAMGAAVSDEVRAKYDAEFAKTLKAVRAVIDTGAVRPAVMIAVAKSVHWHADYGDGEPAEVAGALFAGLPNALEFRTLAALSDGWGHVFLGKISADTWDRDRTAFVRALRDDLKVAYNDPVALTEFISATLIEMRDAQLSERSEYVLISELLRDDVQLARAFIAAAERDPDGPLAEFASNAINEMLVAEPEEGRSVVERLLGGQVRNLRQAAAWGYGGLRRDLTADDLDLLSRIVADGDNWVAGSGIRVGWSWRGSDPDGLVDVLMNANVHGRARLADDLCMALTEMNKRPLPLAAISKVLDKLKSVPELDGHWIEEFLADASERAGIETAQFFFERVRRASTPETFSKMRPINYGPWGHVPLRFAKSPQLAEVLGLAWAFLHEPSEGFYFEHNAAHMFEAMFKPLGDVAVRFFGGVLETASAVDLELISTVLHNAPSNFVFEHKEFVFRFLERCRIAGAKVHKHATGALVASAGSGVRSSSVGEPSPKDLEMIARAEAVLKGLSRASAAYATYDSIRKWHEWSVKTSELEDLDDEDE